MTSRNNHFRSNLRDLEFNLFEFLDLEHTLIGRAPYTDMDATTAREVLRALDEFVSEQLASSYVASDREPMTLDADGNVTLPKVFADSLRAYMEAGWDGLQIPVDFGGYGAPPPLGWAGFELVSGANAAAGFYVFSPFMALIIGLFGTEQQKRRYFPQCLENHWGGAMSLTEADAGSDVGSARTKARHLADDVWEIEGSKRFITNGDFDTTENVVHLVLARPEGASAGTRGLSLFIVPKYWVEKDGSLGARNGMRVTSLEHKMGINGSATCEMVYGGEQQCRGLLMGDVHDGIRQMFQLIVCARMGVGIKSVAACSTGYLRALEYARERVQGPDLARAHDKESPRVRIIEHPDVRRMLMTQKAHTEGMRALYLYCASIEGRVALTGDNADPERDYLRRLHALLLPLVKGYCSERAWDVLSLALQCFGGSGYTQDFPIEQYIRDQKIDTLYEGTTHMQALDFLMRRVARDGGATLSRLLEEIAATAQNSPAGDKQIDGSPAGDKQIDGSPAGDDQIDGSPDVLADARARLGRAVGEVQSILGALLKKQAESIYHIGLQGNRVMFTVAELIIGWLLVRQAELASSSLADASGSERDFYAGKIAAASWYCRDVLSGFGAVRRRVSDSSMAIMELDEEAF